MSTYVETPRLGESIGPEWRAWGPYLSERQWGTVREDYSESGAAWDFFPHEQSRSRAYRWGEDGLLGISDDKQQIVPGTSPLEWIGTRFSKSDCLASPAARVTTGKTSRSITTTSTQLPHTRICVGSTNTPSDAFPYGDLLAG